MPQRDIPSSVDTQLADIYEHIRRIERQLAATATIELPGGVGNLTVLFAQQSWNIGSVPDNDTRSVSLLCEGARPGDFVLIAFEEVTSLPANGASHWDLVGWVLTDDFVWVSFTNHTGVTVNLPAGVIRAVVLHYEP